MSRVVTRLIVAGALVGTVLAAAASSAGPGYHQPRVGSCHELTMRQSLAITAPTAAVDCDKRHTSRTLIVKRYRGQVDWSAATWDGITVPCARKTLQALGGDKQRAMSAYEITFFIPSKEERARGASWKRCEIVLVGGRTLQPLPEKLNLGSLPLPDKYARCLAGPDKHLMLTVCSKAHTYRVTGGFRASGKKYPGQERLAAMAIRRCPELVSSRTWRYQTPGAAEYWRVGYRTITCYSKTRD